MTLEYSIVAIAVALIYAVVTKFFPDFPISPEVFLTVILWLLAMIGIEVVGKPAARGLRSLFGRR